MRENNLGTAHRMLAERGIQKPTNLESARAAFEEALRVFGELGHRSYEAGVKAELIKVLQALVDSGVSPDQYHTRLKELGGVKARGQLRHCAKTGAVPRDVRSSSPTPRALCP